MSDMLTTRPSTSGTYPDLASYLIGTNDPGPAQRSASDWAPNIIILQPGNAVQLAPPRAGRANIQLWNAGSNDVLIGPTPQGLNNYQCVDLPANGTWSIDTEGPVFGLCLAVAKIEVIETYTPLLFVSGSGAPGSYPFIGDALP